MAMEHTPPPWTLTPKDATWGWWWVHTADCDITISGDHDEGNARLIVAAPDTLAMLEEALPHLEDYFDKEYGDDPPEIDLLDRVRAVIAKATGGGRTMAKEHSPRRSCWRR